MPAATITKTTLLQPDYTEPNFYNAVKIAIGNTGFPALYDETLNIPTGVVRSSRAVYEIILDATKTKGKIYFVFGLVFGVYNGAGSNTTVASMGGVFASTNGIFRQAYTSWDVTANTGTDFVNYLQTDSIMDPNTFFDFVSINHPELRAVLIFRNNVYITSIGFLRPQSKPTYWNENNHPYYFVATDSLIGNNFLQHNIATISPFNANLTYSVLNFPTGGVIVPTGKRNISPGVTLIASNSNGPVGKTSADIVLAGTNGTVVGDTLEVVAGVEEYYILNPATGLAIRKV